MDLNGSIIRPKTIQATYRIGDSVTPMMSYFGLILAMACRYKKDLRIGMLIATMLPYYIVFFNRLDSVILSVGVCSRLSGGSRCVHLIKTLRNFLHFFFVVLTL